MATEYNAYRDAYSSINPTPCAFEKGILTQCVACELAEKHLLAERETINCHDVEAWQLCEDLRKILRIRAAFSLKLVKLDGELLPHGQEIKVQCGGLLGLQQALDGTKEITNVHRLVLDAIMRYADLTSFPYSEIVRTIVHFSLRRRN